MYSWIHGLELTLFLGKRKVSDTDLPDGQRERKRAREESEATEEEEPGMCSH